MVLSPTDGSDPTSEWKGIEFRFLGFSRWIVASLVPEAGFDLIESEDDRTATKPDLQSKTLQFTKDGYHVCS